VQRRKVLRAVAVAQGFRCRDNAAAVAVWSIGLRVLDVAEIGLRPRCVAGRAPQLERVCEMCRSLEPNSGAVRAAEAYAGKAAPINFEMLDVPARRDRPRRILKRQVAPRVDVFGLDDRLGVMPSLPVPT